MIKFAYTILYVENVTATIEFYEKAFGFQRKFVTPENDYGELITGETSDNCEADYENALAAGASAFEPLKVKPWGQKVGYVRDINGFLVEICSTMN